MKKVFFLLGIVLLLSACQKQQIVEPPIDDTEVLGQQVSENSLEQEQVPENPKEVIGEIGDAYFQENPDVANSINTIVRSELKYSTTQQAKDTNDVTQCDILTDKNAQSFCKNDYYLFVAIQSSDTSVCEKVSEEGQRECEQRVVEQKATIAKDPDICKALIKETSEESEQTAEYSDFDICTTKVYNTLASETGDEKMCEKIVIEAEKNLCLEFLPIQE